ncbi:hypothetical protein [Paenibacillus sp. R14(2021)]|nr:hypothetical protein [Paenibacillus sp. R14(2021)]
MEAAVGEVVGLMGEDCGHQPRESARQTSLLQHLVGQFRMIGTRLR